MRKDKASSGALIYVAIGVVAVLILSVFFYFAGTKDRFVLESADGPVSIEDFRGKLLLVFFGYASCPVECPAVLLNMGDAFSELTEDELKVVKGLFISFDPERDTPEKLKEYASYFHPNIVGATAREEVVKELAKRFNAFYVKTKEEESELGYNYSHSLFIHVVAPDGSIAGTLSGRATPEEIVAAIRKMIEKYGLK